MELHELIAGLDGAQDLYERGRPAYPPELIEAIARACGLAPGARVLDLGAGTGKLSLPLLEAGYDVVAVEPLESMRARLAAKIGAERVHAGTAEAIPLPDGSVDAVVCGDSYHWFDPDTAPAEIHRVLRPGGAVGLTWRWAEGARGPAWVPEFERLLEAVRPEHPGFTADRGTGGLERHGGFSPVVRSRESFEHRTTVAGLCAYAASITYVAVLPEQRRAAPPARDRAARRGPARALRGADVRGRLGDAARLGVSARLRRARPAGRPAAASSRRPAHR